MYLSALNKTEKAKFLELAYKLAYSDLSFSNSEISILDKYKDELGLSTIPVTKSIDQLIEDLAASSLEAKKIIYFEAYGLVLADAQIAPKEHDILVSMKAKFNLYADTAEAIEAAAEKLYEAYKAAHNAVIG